MKISFINESTINYGANLTTVQYMAEAKKRGYDVVYNIVDSSVDFFVIGMYFAPMEKQLREFLKPKRYVFIEHSIEILQDYNKWLRDWLMPNSYKNFFFSPRHRQHVEDGLPAEYKYLAKENIRYLIVPIDYNLFRILPGIERRKNLSIFVGFIHPNKGIEDILKIAQKTPLEEYWLIGTFENGPYKESDFEKYHNVFYKGEIPQEEMPRYYNEAQSCYLLPTNGAVESAGRTIAEAVLCGCNPRVNNNVGIASYGWFRNPIQVKKNIDKSNDLFFRIIESILT
jgi:glycosyltransferase involved in cell wall biosynthesis